MDIETLKIPNEKMAEELRECGAYREFCFVNMPHSHVCIDAAGLERMDTDEQAIAIAVYSLDPDSDEFYYPMEPYEQRRKPEFMLEAYMAPGPVEANAVICAIMQKYVLKQFTA